MGRIRWIDMLRGIGMFLVICGHVFKPAGLDGTVKWIYSFHMPLFFMISGCVHEIQSRNKAIPQPGDFLKKKVRQMVIPYLCLNFLAVPHWYLNYKVLDDATTSVGTIIKGIFTSISGPANPMWFVVVLLWVNLVFYAIQYFSKGRMADTMLSVLVLFGLGVIFRQKYGTEEVALHWNLVYMALLFFGLGYFFMANKERIDAWLGETRLKRYWIGGFVLALGTLADAMNIKVSMYSDEMGNPLLFLMSSLGISFGLLMFVEKLPVVRLIEYVGQNTIVYLAFHIPILRTFQKFNAASLAIVEQHPLLLSLFIYVILIPVCMLFHKYLPFVVGRRYQKKEKKSRERK